MGGITAQPTTRHDDRPRERARRRLLRVDEPTQLGARSSRRENMSRGVAIAWGVTLHLLGLLAARAAHSESGAPSPRFAFLDASGPPLPDLPPQPTREADEYPRRAWEAFPSGGVSTPFCRGSAYGLGHCGDATTGATLGIGALYRVSPYVAVGLDASLVRFTLHGPSGGAAPRTHASFIGFLVRGYFLDRGVFDPYVETGFGQGASVARHLERATEDSGPDGTPADTRGSAAADIEVRTEFAAPAVMAGAGIDFWLAPYLRVGPALTYRFSWISMVQGCWGSTCTPVGVDERGAVGSYATVSLRATIAVGREM
jgi:hypothetical protein